MTTLFTAYLNSSGVCTDTRKIKKDCIFFALKGANFNGNLFATQALELGAKYAVIDELSFSEEDDRLIIVEDVLSALQELAKENVQKLSIPVIGITGSNGKTTTKELIAAVLSKKFKINYTKGNLNNEIGVPLTILDSPENTELLIVEMGANHQGEIALLSTIAQPVYGIITNMGKAHLEGFGGIEGVKKGKSELYLYLAKNDGKIFINLDDEVLCSTLPEASQTISYHTNAFRIKDDFPFLIIQYNDTSINTHLNGVYNVSNIAAAYNIGLHFGIREDLIIEAIENYVPTNNRSELLKYKNIDFIKDAYNANPSSVFSSLHSFFQNNADKKSVILGDMLELGEFAEEEHAKILAMLQSYGKLLVVILVGPIYYNLKDEFPQFHFYKSIDDAKTNIKLESLVNHTVLLKGSRGIALEKLLDS